MHVLLLLFWRAPLGVPSTIHRHQPPQRMVLSQVDCFVQCKVVGSQFFFWMVFSHVIRGRPGGLFQFSGGQPLGSTSHLHHHYLHYHNHFVTLFRDHPGEPVPKENFWTLWCKGRLIEADTPTIRLGATPSGLTSAHLHHPQFFTGWMPFLPPNEQCQSTEGN